MAQRTESAGPVRMVSLDPVPVWEVVPVLCLPRVASVILLVRPHPPPDDCERIEPGRILEAVIHVLVVCPEVDFGPVRELDRVRMCCDLHQGAVVAFCPISSLNEINFTDPTAKAVASYD